MVLKVKYPNDETIYKVKSFDEIRDDCICLYANSIQITSLEGIETLTQLQELDCSDNLLTSLEHIKHLIQLQVLWCENNQITSLEGTENLSQLRQFNCCGNQLTSIKGVENLIQLEEFYCNDNELTSLPLSLMNCINLRYINYEYNPIDNIPLQLR